MKVLKRTCLIPLWAALLWVPLSSSQGGPLPAAERERIHQLAAHADKIKREVKITETGYISSIVCEDEALLKELKAHVKAMEARLDSGMPVRMWDPAYVEFVREYEDISHTFQETPQGFQMTVVAKTPSSIKAAQLHARVVSDFVANGMEGLQRTHDAAWANGGAPKVAGDVKPEAAPAASACCGACKGEAGKGLGLGHQGGEGARGKKAGGGGPCAEGCCKKDKPE